MSAITTDYKLAASHNSAGSLVAITSITDGTNALVEPLGLPNYTAGIKRYRADGRVNLTGVKSSALIFSYMTVGQYAYLKTNYEGLVTARLALGSTTFANYNCTLVMPLFSEMDYIVIDSLETVGFSNVRVDLLHIVAI